ncbi:hypothetical protein PsorP6_005667 [Peronosclerospora sorghi]|uniref:Uncharacterized protein n=1 Tax=Peronosclerospora sorghi TaxID=230839 RepID=A0ACC0W1Q0_9STRA|nr:hypothetical protein PsorP6_005667 [Peronosclerospora sorghi]
MYHDVEEPLMDAAASGTPAPRGPAFTMPGVAGGANLTANTAHTQPSSSTSATAASTANPWGTTGANAASSGVTGASANPWAALGSGLGGMGGIGGESGGLGGNPEMMTQMMQSPLFQAALAQVASNPEQFLAQIEAMNPQMAAALNSNPQMRQMMSNPESFASSHEPSKSRGKSLTTTTSVRVSELALKKRSQPSRERNKYVTRL